MRVSQSKLDLRAYNIEGVPHANDGFADRLRLQFTKESGDMTLYNPHLVVVVALTSEATQAKDEVSDVSDFRDGSSQDTKNIL